MMVGTGWETIAFRLTVLASLAVVLTFMFKMVTALQSKAKDQQRIESKQEALVERLDRFIETQDTANGQFRESIDHLMRRGRDGAAS